MLDWPEQNHTSPNKTSVIVIVSPLGIDAEMSYALSDASVGGNNTFQRLG